MKVESLIESREHYRTGLKTLLLRQPFAAGLELFAARADTVRRTISEFSGARES